MEPMEEIVITTFLTHSFHSLGQIADGDRHTCCSPTRGFFLKSAAAADSYLPREAPDLCRVWE